MGGSGELSLSRNKLEESGMILLMLKGKEKTKQNHQPRILYLEKLCYKCEEEIMIFSDKQKLRPSIARKKGEPKFCSQFWD